MRLYHLLVLGFGFLAVCRLAWRDRRSGLVLVQAARLTDQQAAGPVPVRAASPAGEETRSPRGVSVRRHQGDVRLPATRLLLGRTTVDSTGWIRLGTGWILLGGSDRVDSSLWCAGAQAGDGC